MAKADWTPQVTKDLKWNPYCVCFHKTCERWGFCKACWASHAHSIHGPTCNRADWERDETCQGCLAYKDEYRE